MKTHALIFGLLAAALVLAQNTFATDYEQNIEKTFKVTPGGELSLQVDRGSVNVTTDQRDEARVRVFRKVKGGSKADADELFANHRVTLSQEGNKVIVVASNKTNKTFSWTRNRPGLEVRERIAQLQQLPQRQGGSP